MSTPATNVAWTIPAAASTVQHLTKKSLSVPKPGPKQALIRITGAALNFRDMLISVRSPAYPGDHKPDLVPGSDGAGVIVSTGPSSRWSDAVGTSAILHPGTWLNGDVRNLRLDKIFGGYSVDGTLQQYIAVDDEQVIPAPKGWSGVELAALVTAGGTAWNAIRGSMDGALNGELREWKGAWTDKRLEGQWVLTQGTGGVSSIAIQIASALGATVIATSSSDAKLDFAKSLGAKHVINYRNTPDWDQEVLRITGGSGVDHVIEVGGASTIMKSIASVRPGGLISVIGILTQEETIPAALIPSLLFSGKIIKGCLGFSRDLLADLLKFADANKFKPVIAQEFGLGEVTKAFEALQQQSSVGKIVVKVSDA